MDKYEKLYNEALDRMKHVVIVPKDEKALQALKETIFPQLRESEDERIRKDIVALIKFGLNDGSAVSPGSYTTKEEAIAYLEKQKDCFLVPKSHLDPAGKPGVDGMKILEKQKEQKLAEIHNPTDEEVESWRNELTEFKKFATKQAKENQLHISYTRDVMWENFCSELLSFVNSRKPVEWSEEDEDMLNSCISSIEEAKENRYAYRETDGDTSYDHEIAWLKSLRPSKK